MFSQLFVDSTYKQCERITESQGQQWGLCQYVIVHTILGGSPVILWISLGGKPKWLPLKFGYHDVMRTIPILQTTLENAGIIKEIGMQCRRQPVQ